MSDEGLQYEKQKGDEFDEDSDDEDGVVEYAEIKMSYLDEKVAALCALGHFAMAAPQQF